MANLTLHSARSVFPSSTTHVCALPGSPRFGLHLPLALRKLHKWLLRLTLSGFILPLFLVAPLSSAQIVETVAGGGIGDGAAAIAAFLSNGAEGIAIDAVGNLYITDGNHHRVRKLTSSTGIITTVAGNGYKEYNGDNIAAVSASINHPRSVVVDASGNLYIADSNSRIRKVSAATGIISTVAGTGTAGYDGDNIAAVNAKLNVPSSLALDAAGNLYLADQNNVRIRKVNSASGVITTVAGSGLTGYDGDNVPATSAALSGPKGITLDASGNLYIADTGNSRIRKVAVSTGIITTIAGAGSPGSIGDGIPAINATLFTPVGVAIDSSGNLYIADSDSRVRKITAATGIISTAAGTGTRGYSGDNTAATAAMLDFPTDVALDQAGNLYIADQTNRRIRKVTAATGIISTVAGVGTTSFNGDNIAATSAILNNPLSVAVDSSGNVFFADTGNQRIRKVTAATGFITTVAGSGVQGYNGDNIAATNAMLNFPYGVAVDSSGNVYFADSGNNRIRKVTTGSGNITTVVGNGIATYNGDNISAVNATVNNPVGVAVDSLGDLYIADSRNNRIRKVTVATGVITTVAGNGESGFYVDNLLATNAALSNPVSVALDSSKNLYIVDQNNGRIRKVEISTGVLKTVVGSGLQAFNGDADNIPALSAKLNIPTGVAVDSKGNLYISESFVLFNVLQQDTGNHRIRKVNADTQIITKLIGGIGPPGYNGDGNASNTMLAFPSGIALDSADNLYIADSRNHRIRKLSAAPSVNFHGLWWNSPAGSESGWGINLAHQGNLLFATWFTYDAAGKGLWLSMTASKSNNAYIGTLYQTRGPAFSAIPFSPAAVTRTAVGSGTLTFSDANNGRFGYVLNGTTQTKEITRQVFGPLPACSFGAQPRLDFANNFQDLWWAAPAGIESGWGVNFTHQGDTIFATWFTYDTDGTPMWLSATVLKTGFGIYSGSLFRTTGPAFNAVPFIGSNVKYASVGTLELSFTNTNDGTFTYSVNGVTQSKPITRQLFNSPATVCL